jgi:cyclic-di-AMP phosphodiesterase PgpH
VPQSTSSDERALDRIQQRISVASRTRRVSVVVLFWLLVSALLYIHLVAVPSSLTLGQMVPYNILAPIDYNYLDKDRLSQLTGLDSDEIIAVVNPDFAAQAEKRLEEFRRDVDNIRRVTDQLELSHPRAQQMISAAAGRYNVDATTIFALVGMDKLTFNDALSQARELLSEQMNSQVFRSELIVQIRADAKETIEAHPENVYVFFLQPNLERRPEALEAARAKAQVRVMRGNAIAVKGQPASETILQQLALIRENLAIDNFYRLAGLALLLAGGILLWFQYLRRFGARPLLRVGALVQFGTLFTGFLVVGLLIGRIPFSEAPYVVSLAVVALVCSIVMVYDAMFGLYLGLGLAVMLGIALHYEADLMVYLLGGALLPPVFLTQWSRRRSQMLFALLLALFNASLATVITLMSTLPFEVHAVVAAGLSGMGGAILALGLLPVIETLSSQLTPGKLMELANPENDLLKKMKREAHGTYAHSQMVADLVEEGCNDIGANALMARVGALYHDIGKLRRPSFFAENIHDLTRNPHLGLPAESSAKILKDHVTDGLQLAREAYLPRELHRFIAEHHGTYLIKYFYYQARQLHRSDPDKHPEPSEAFFHYPGPIPQSRESGALMLADVTEAVTRARGEMEEDELRMLLDQIFSEKIEEDQLTDSGLTIGDLEKLKDAYFRVVMGTMHHRVRYPHEIATGIQFHYVADRQEVATAIERHY